MARETFYYKASNKAEIFANHLKKQFKTQNYSIWVDEIVRKTIKRHDNQLYNNNLLFSPGKIWNIIKKLLHKRMQGLDGIGNKCLKNCNKKITVHFCNILNSCTRYTSIPFRNIGSVNYSILFNGIHRKKKSKFHLTKDQFPFSTP